MRLSRAQARTLGEPLERPIEAFFAQASRDEHDETSLFHVALARDAGHTS